MRAVRIAIRRSASFVPVLIAVTLVAFLLTRVIPGNPIAQLAGPMATADERQAVAHEYGLDRPLWVQYLLYMQGLVHGNFGVSLDSGRPVAADLSTYFPATLELTICAALVATVVGISLGVLAAVTRDTWIDHLIRVLVVIGAAVPAFWLALGLIYLFYFNWHLLPAPLGQLPVLSGTPPKITGLVLVDSLLSGDFQTFSDALRQLVLPVFVLALGAFAPLARMTRASMLDVLDSDHVRASRALGIRWRSIVWKYALKNALLPTLTVLALIYGYLLGGTVLIENIFAWPGLGRYVYTAITGSDYPAVEGFILYATAMYLLVFLALDVIYRILDPRIAV